MGPRNCVLAACLLLLQGCEAVSYYEYYAPGGVVQSGLVAEGDTFTLNEKPILLLSGAFHYFRVHPAHWRDTFKKLRAAGLNTIETYSPWNLHEPRQGEFDFGQLGEPMSPFLDIRTFIQMAQEEDMFVILRPGPYICSEWDFGGMPSYLLRDPTMEVRTYYENFRLAAARYFDALLPYVADLQFTRGGPIIAMQVENEYGHFGYGTEPRDTQYLEFLRDNMIANGFGESLFFTSDTPATTQDLGAIPGVLMTANFKGEVEENLDLLLELQPDRPLMVMEFWTGWFDHWLSGTHVTWAPEKFATALETIMQYNSSVNFYMFIGGTSFGFMAGANKLDVWPKYGPDVSSYGSSEKKRKVLSLAQKMEVIEAVDGGLGWTQVGKKFGLHEATVRSIYKIREKIRESVRASADISCKVASVSRRDPLLEKMEKILNRWIIDQVDQRKSNVDSITIREKAKSLYEHLAQTEPSASTDSRTFNASHGWFHRFQHRFSLHNIARTGESGSADAEGAKAYHPVFQSLIEDGNYSPEQVFNADETGLFYKKMGNRTYIHKEVKKLPGFKAFKDRVTLLFAGNAAGDCKLKPMLVYRAENPRALKGLNKRFLPVVWKSNRRAWVTAKIFEEWFHQDFVPEVKLYLAKKNLAFRAILLVDNAGGHTAQSLNLEHPHVTVSYLPPRTTSLLQPMDMGIIKTFKSNYQRAVYRESIKKMDADSSMSLLDYWKQFNIRDAVCLIKQAWDEVKPSTMNACWNALWPESVNNFQSFPKVDEQIKDILKMAREVGGEGFDDMTEDDVAEIIDSHDVEPSVEELIQLQEEEARDGHDDEEEEGEDTQTRPVFTIRQVRNLLRETEKLTSLFIDQDPLLERSMKFKRGVNELLLPYKETLRMMEASACQKPITSYFKPSPSSTPAKKHAMPATPATPVTATPVTATPATPATPVTATPATPATPVTTHQTPSSSSPLVERFFVSPVSFCGFDDPDDPAAVC